MPPNIAAVSTADWKEGLDDPSHFARVVLGIDLHPGQRRWIRNSTRRENILVTGNRWGKSFVSAVKLLHRLVYRPRPLQYDKFGRYRAMVASITQDQAGIIFDTALRLARQSAWLSPLIRSTKRTPFPQLVLTNGARLEARSTQNRGQYLLGNDFDFVIFDEVAFEPDPDFVVEEVILMRLADRRGTIDLVSTPNGKNWFYRRTRKAREDAGRYVQSGDSRENSRISREYLDERVRFFSESRLHQNIMGQFVDSGGEIIPGRHITDALRHWDARKRPKDNDPPASVGSGLYITGWDLARKRTATVGITVELCGDEIRIVELERFRNLDWPNVIEHIRARQLAYPGRLLIDATGLGDVVVQQPELATFAPESVVFTQSVKAELLTNVELLHARGRLAYGRWELPDGPGRVWSLEDELRAARWDDNNECDALMALALALWPLASPAPGNLPPRVSTLQAG